MERLKKFFASPKGEHVYSFVKTYLTVFLTLYLFGIDSEGKEMFDVAFILASAKYSLLSVLRTIFKLISEK